jgi:hypothetical protein
MWEQGAFNRYPNIPFTNTFESRFFISVEYDEIRYGRSGFQRGNIANMGIVS